MYKVEHLTKEHLLPLLSQDINANLKAVFTDELLNNLDSVAGAVAFTRDGVTLVCGGITAYWPGRGQLWCVFNEEAKFNFVPVFRAVKKWLNLMQEQYQRIELSVNCSFPSGRRRAELLGFSLEVERAKKYLIGGEDCSLYSMVRE